ncbi:MAG: hypothetical protein ACRD0U_14910, partial [Acidimicrobiales bacterium]
LWGAVLPFDLEDTLGLMGAVRALSDGHADEVRDVLAAGGGLAALAAAVVGPTLEVSLAARQAAALDPEERQRRAEWMFPGADLTDEELDDPEVMDEVLEEWDWVGFDDELADEDERAAAPIVEGLFKVTIEALLEDEPPEVWETAQRLERLGVERPEIVRMLASTMVEQFRAMVLGEADYDLDRHLRDLAQLPESYLARMKDL